MQTRAQPQRWSCAAREEPSSLQSVSMRAQQPTRSRRQTPRLRCQLPPPPLSPSWCTDVCLEVPRQCWRTPGSMTMEMLHCWISAAQRLIFHLLLQEAQTPAVTPCMPRTCRPPQVGIRCYLPSASSDCAISTEAAWGSPPGDGCPACRAEQSSGTGHASCKICGRQLSLTLSQDLLGSRPRHPAHGQGMTR